MAIRNKGPKRCKHATKTSQKYDQSERVPIWNPVREHHHRPRTSISRRVGSTRFQHCKEKTFRCIQGQPLRNLIWQHVYACVSLVDLLGSCVPCHILDQCSICLSCISVLIWVDWRADPSPMPKLHMITTWQLLAWRYHWPLTGALALCIPTCDKPSKPTNQATNQKRKKISRYEHTHTHPGKAGQPWKHKENKNKTDTRKAKLMIFVSFFFVCYCFSLIFH